MSAASFGTLTWEPNNEPNLAGYKVYWGAIPGPLIIEDVGNQNSWEIPSLGAGLTYSFAVSAYSTTGLESPRSGSIIVEVPANLSLKVSWTPVNLLNLLGYTLTYGELNSFGTTVPTGNKTFSIISEVLPGKTYFFYPTVQLLGGINLTLHNLVTYTVPLEATSLPELQIGLAPNPADTTAPAVAITSPDNGSSVNGPTSVNVSATDNVGVTRVNLYVDDQLTAYLTDPPFTFSWDASSVSDGEHRLDARASDAAGNSGVSATVTVTVAANAPAPGDTTAPTVAITSPSNGASVSGITSVTVSASDDVGVDRVNLYVDGQLVSYSVTAPFTTAWDVSTVGAGQHTLQVSAVDADGNTGVSGNVTVTKSLAPPADTTPPAIAITSPRDGDSVNGLTTVTASATDNVEVARVNFYVDGKLTSYTTRPPFTMTWDASTASAGQHTLEARAVDTSGNATTSAGVTVSTSQAPATDTEAPSVAITSPRNGDILTGVTAVTISASDNVEVMRVNFYVDGTLTAYTTRAPFTITWDALSVPSGPHTLQARAVDTSGNAATSAMVTITSSQPGDTTAPTVAITSPENGDSVTGPTVITVNASDNVAVMRVSLYVDDQLTAYTAEAPFTIGWDASTVAAGPHNLQIRAVDTAGNTGTSSVVAVTVSSPVEVPDTTAPAATIVSPTNGSVVQGVLEVRVATSDNVGVKRVNFFVDGKLTGYSGRAPFTISWNTTKSPDGQRQLKIQATDAAGNTGTSAISTVLVSNGD